MEGTGLICVAELLRGGVNLYGKGVPFHHHSGHGHEERDDQRIAAVRHLSGS